MIPVEEALERILSQFHILEPEDKPILDSMGQVLAEDVYSDMDSPPLDNSAMDGYAVRARDIDGASKSAPKYLKIISEVAAGYLATVAVKPATAVRIMTGAPIPEGADTVVQFEDTDEQERKAQYKPLNEIGIMREIKAGTNIRRTGEDIARGSLVVKSGAIIRPQEIGVLASLGRARIPVVRRPVVGVLATGDELVNVGEPLPRGKIYNSNTYSMAAQVIRYGGIPMILGIARDTMPDLEEKINRGQNADMIITSAGVSTGEYDMVKDVLAKKGEIKFWTVKMKPGKPLAFGVLRLGGRTVPHLGLPGNPVSSMVSFEQFARPAILKMQGRKDLSKPTIQATSDSTVENRDGRRVFLRVSLTERQGRYHAMVAGQQGSAILSSMIQADGLMIIPEDTPLVKAGDTVQVQMLDWSQEFQTR